MPWEPFAVIGGVIIWLTMGTLTARSYLEINWKANSLEKVLIVTMSYSVWPLLWTYEAVQWVRGNL